VCRPWYGASEDDASHRLWPEEESYSTVLKHCSDSVAWDALDLPVSFVYLRALKCQAKVTRVKTM